MASQRQRFLPGAPTRSSYQKLLLPSRFRPQLLFASVAFCKDSDTLLANVHLNTDEHKGLLDRLLEASPARSAGASRKVQDAMLLDADSHLEQQDPVISTFEL